jgi:hypothetical protein
MAENPAGVNLKELTIPPDAVAVILVTLSAAQKIQVAGSLDQKLIAVGMLDIAKQAIYAHHKKLEEGGPRIHQPLGVLDPSKLRV